MDQDYNLINLCLIPTDEDELEEDVYDDEAYAQILHEQIRLCDTKFKDLLLLRSQHIVKATGDLINTFLKPSLFLQDKFGYLNAMALMLGMYVSDHPSTLDNLENAIREKFIELNMGVKRFTPDLLKQKKMINNLLEEEVMPAQNIVIILEKTQMIDRICLDHLINRLITIESESVIRRNIILIFCLASNKPAINRIITPDRMKMIRPNPVPVVKFDQDENALDEIMQVLIDGADTSFKLGPRMVTLLKDQFSVRDPSITNIKYLFTCALYEHYDNEESFLLEIINSRSHFNKSEIIKRVNSMANSIRDLKSVQGASEFSNLNWDSDKSVAKLVVSKVEHLLLYHKYLISQLCYYFHLLRDETRLSFPSSITNLYTEAFVHRNLGMSANLLNAINRFHKLSADRAIQRLNKCLDNVKQCPQLFQNDDMIEIIKEFAKKLERKIQEHSKPRHSGAIPMMEIKDCQVIIESEVSIDPLATQHQEAYVELAQLESSYKIPNSIKAPVLRSRKTKEMERVRGERQKLSDQYNKEVESLLLQFEGQLSNHASKLGNPFGMPLCEIIYFDEVDTIKELCIPSTRFTSRSELYDSGSEEILKSDDQSSYSLDESVCVNQNTSMFSEDDQQVDLRRLFNIIYEEGEEICVNDIYNLFEDRVKATNIVCEVEQKEPPNKRRKTRGSKLDNVKTIEKLVIKRDDRLLKSRFVNAITDLSVMGIVEPSCKRSKRDVLQKVAWL